MAAYIEIRQQIHSTPTVKQQLAARRMLFDWLISGHVVPANPAAAVRGRKHAVKTGKTPLLVGKDWRKLIDAIPTGTVRDHVTAAPRFIPACAGNAVPLVPLHSGFDWLQARQVGGIDQDLDATSDAFLTSNQAVAFEGKQHVMN